MTGLDKTALEALRDLVDHVDRNTCTHESTHRRGFIWTFCDECGRKWADDEGGFQPYEDAPALARARAALSALPAVTEEQVEATAELTKRASYMVGNPSAWDSYDKRASEMIRSLLAALSTASLSRPVEGSQPAEAAVAWRYRLIFNGKQLPWQTTTEKWLAERKEKAGAIVEPLYASPAPAAGEPEVKALAVALADQVDHCVAGFATRKADISGAMRRLSELSSEFRSALVATSHAKAGESGRPRWKIPARELSNDDLVAEFNDAQRKFSDRGEHGGSPGEFWFERMGEIETEQARRAKAKEG